MSIEIKNQQISNAKEEPQPQPASYRPQQKDKYPSYPKRILETIYGNKFSRNSKHLMPINISTDSTGKANASNKNASVGQSSDYYTFQRVIANFNNKNHQNLNYTSRNTSSPMQNIQRNSPSSANIAKNPNSPGKVIKNISPSKQSYVNGAQKPKQKGIQPHPNINYQKFRKTFSISRPTIPSLSNTATTNINPNINHNVNTTSKNNLNTYTNMMNKQKNMNINDNTKNKNYNLPANTYNKPNNFNQNEQYNTCTSNISSKSGQKNNAQLQSLSRKNSNSNLKPTIKPMSNTTTGFNRNSIVTNASNTSINNIYKYQKNSQNSNKNYSIMSNTTSNFRPPTSHMRQCNNQAQDYNNYLSKYQIIKQLGKGTYGVVHLARKKIKKVKVEQLSFHSVQNRTNQELFSFNYGNIVRQKLRQNSVIFQPYQRNGKQQQYSTVIENLKNKNQNKSISKQKQNKGDLSSMEVQFHDTRDKIQVSHVQSSIQQRQHIVNKEDMKQSQIATTNNTNNPQSTIKIQHHYRSQSPFLSQSTKKPQNGQVQKREQEQDSQNLFAIKIYQKFKMNKDPTKFKNIRKQINVMENIKHPHIIKLYQSVQTLTKINIVVQYGGKQSLLDYLKEFYPLPDHAMRRISLQLLSAINYLHDKNIVHRDIKLQNILMLKGNVKLIDFGFSTLTHKNRKLNSICGTPNYMAPEVLSKKQYIGQFADIWSYGVVVFTIAQGRHPFKAQSYNQLERLVNKGVFQFKKITNPIHQSFIKRIMKIKPHQRPRASDLMSHPWLAIKDDQELTLTNDNKTTQNPIQDKQKIKVANQVNKN